MGDTKNDISADEVITFPNNIDLTDVCDKSDEFDKKDISDKHVDTENDTSADEVIDVYEKPDESDKEDTSDKHGDAENDTSAITLPNNVDFADAATMRRLVEENKEEEELEEEKRAKDNSNVENPADISTEIVEENEEEKEVEEKRAEDNSNVKNSVDISTEMIVNMFLRSPHGYDFYDSGAKMSLEDVKERVDIFILTNMDSDISDVFKFKVARRILDKVLDQHFDVIHLEDMSMSSSPAPPTYPQPTPELAQTYQQQSAFHFDDGASVTKSVRSKGIGRRRPCPEDIPRQKITSSQSLPPKSPSLSRRGNSTGRGKTVIVGGPMAGGNRYHQRNNTYQPKDDDESSAVSRASTVASLALETIYRRIDACKQKLLDPMNNIDEQIATASLLEKLATAAVAVKEMEQLDE